PRRSSDSWGVDRVLVDFEAKLAAKPTAVYRKEHPWIDYEEIKAWRDGPDYEQKLKDFCFSTILNPHGIRSLGHIRDPRALAALHSMCALTDGSIPTDRLIRTLEERSDPSFVPWLKKLRPPDDTKPGRESIERLRKRAIERIRLLEKYSKELKDKPLDSEQQTNYMNCRDDLKGLEEFIANLRKCDYDYFLWRYLQVAGYVDSEPMRSCLRQMLRENSRDDRTKAMVHGALAQLGEMDSIEYLKGSLTHKNPGVRLA